MVLVGVVLLITGCVIGVGVGLLRRPGPEPEPERPYQRLIRRELVVQMKSSNEALSGLLVDETDEYLVLEPATWLPGKRPVDGAALFPLDELKWIQIPSGTRVQAPARLVGVDAEPEAAS